MAHNPPRPLACADAASIQRIADEIARRPQRQWNDIGELADLLEKKSKASKTVTITAGTASFIASHLRTVHAKPTRDEVALLLCKHKCETPCYECTGRANCVVRVYGHSIRGG